MHRRSFVRALALGGFAGSWPALPGRAADSPARTWHSPLLRDHPLAGRIWDTAAGREVARETLVERLARAQLRLLGEVHDNPDHHAIQAELVDALGALGLTPLVAFEQFEAEHDAALRQVPANAAPDEIARAVRFDQSWNWALYRPIVAAALRHGMPLKAANASRASLSPVVKRGLAAVEPPRAAALRLEAAWSAEREAALRETIRDGHCGALPESAVPGMAAAQRVRDATLAESLLAAGGDGAVLIAGNGHVRRDLAVPLYLAAAAPGKTVCALGILEVEAEKRDPQAYTHPAVAGGPAYDLVWLTPRWERPDPCEGFRK